MFQTGSYSYSAIEKWVKVKVDDVFKLGLMFTPVNIENSHWTLCVADIQNKATPVHNKLPPHCPAQRYGASCNLRNLSLPLFSALSTWTQWVAQAVNTSKA